MVARKTDAESWNAALFREVFAFWRRLVWRTGTGAKSTAETLASDGLSLARGSAAPLTRSGFLIIGLLCVAAGASGIAFVRPGGVTVDSALAAIAYVVWAIVRRYFLGIFVKDTKVQRSEATAAWAAGLVPLAAGMTDWLAALAWLASGVITAWVLGFFVARARAARLVTAAWLTQLAVQVGFFALNLIAMYLLVALFAST